MDFDTVSARYPLALDDNGCWVWEGAKTEDGYGYFFESPRRVFAHRRVFILANGPIGQRMRIDHVCRNRACVNPDHLEQ